MGLSCGVVCVILCLAVLIQYRSVTDRHTQTHRHTTTANTALSIASRGKNYCTIILHMWFCVQISNVEHVEKPAIIAACFIQKMGIQMSRPSFLAHCVDRIMFRMRSHNLPSYTSLHNWKSSGTGCWTDNLWGFPARSAHVELEWRFSRANRACLVGVWYVNMVVTWLVYRRCHQKRLGIPDDNDQTTAVRLW